MSGRDSYKKRGFILLIVIGMLAALAMVAVQFVESSRTSYSLTALGVFRTKARLMARSGFEQSYGSLVIQDLKENRGLETVSQSIGTEGSFFAESLDANALINVNDGITAGRLELGNSYVANAVDPFPAVPQSPDAETSAWLNLRTRRLLNAYGEVLRNEAHAGSDPFVFLSADAEDRGSPIPYRAQALGDVLIANRPGGGYKDLESFSDLVNQWGRQVDLNAGDLGFLSLADLVTLDLTVGSFEDNEFSRITDESQFGIFTNRILAANDEDYAHVDFKSLAEEPPALAGIFSRHPFSPINVNAASRRVRAALFYAPVNVSLAVISAETYKPHTVATHYLDDANVLYRQLPEYGAMMMPLIGIAGPCFADSRLTEGGVHHSSGVGRVQTNRLMSLADAIGLAAAYDDYLAEIDFSIATMDGVWTFEDFGLFLRHHRNSWLGRPGNPQALERALPPGTGFDPSWNRGFFTQDYLEKILPHVLSPVRRLPRYLGAPQALLSPVYDPVEPKPGVADSHRGQFTAEDFVVRSTLPKISFVSFGTYRIVSQGRCGPGRSATSKLESLVELFKTSLHRAQDDFESLTATTPGLLSRQTSTEMKIGPESTPHRGGSGTQTPSPALGFVGLHDLVEEPAPSGVSPRFYLDGDPGDFLGLSNIRQFTQPNADPHLGSPYHTTAGFQFADSTVEGADTAFLEDGHSGSDLSPFGGYLLHSRGHGLFGQPAATKRFHDSIYWNLAHPTEPTSVFRLGSGEDPPGRSLKKGLVSLWFRIPTGYHLINTEALSGSHPAQTTVRDPFYTLFSMTIWEQFKPLDVYSGTSHLVRPVEIKFGYSYDNSDNKGKLIARFEHHSYTYNQDGSLSRLHWMMGGPVGFRSAPFIPFSSYPASVDAADSSGGNEGGEGETEPGGSSTLYHDPQDIHFLGIPGEASGPVNVANWVRTGSRLVENTLTLSDAPENGPGTWHRVSLEWDMQPGSGAYAPLRIHLHDGIHREFGSDTSVHNTALNYQSMISFNTQNSFVLGETFNRHHFSADNDWYPGWRLNSAVDNVRFYCDQIPPVDLTAPYPRYDLNSAGGGGPTWVVQPSLLHGAGEFEGARLYSVGTRIYWPQDELNNYPDVVISATNGTHPTLMNHYRPPVGHPDNPNSNPFFLSPGNLEMIYPDPDDVTFSIFPPSAPARLSDGFRIYCQYLGSRRHRGSQAAVMDSGNSDHFLVIPWVKEISYRYQPVGHPKINSWSTFN